MIEYAPTGPFPPGFEAANYAAVQVGGNAVGCEAVYGGEFTTWGAVGWRFFDTSEVTWNPAVAGTNEQKCSLVNGSEIDFSIHSYNDCLAKPDQGGVAWFPGGAFAPQDLGERRLELAGVGVGACVLSCFAPVLPNLGGVFGVDLSGLGTHLLYVGGLILEVVVLLVGYGYVKTIWGSER